MSYYKVQYNTSTDNSPPAIRSIYTNFTSFADITKIQLAWENTDGLDITGWLFSFEADGFVEITNNDDDTEFGIYKIIILNNNTDSPTNPYIELEVVPTQINGVEYIPGTNNLVVSHWNTSGSDGSSGTSGIDGTSGVDGGQGESGPAGSDGILGADGASGTSGVDGLPGANGVDGVDGTSGVDGPQGTQGEPGIAGEPGEPGPAADGADGTSGTSGVDGSSGISPLEGVDIDVIIANLEAIVAELKKK